MKGQCDLLRCKPLQPSVLPETDLVSIVNHHGGTSSKKRFFTLEYNSGICDHGLEGSVHLYHCQRILKALLKFCNSRTLSPPSFFGLCTLLQLTRQLPLLTSSLSCQRNPLLILSIVLMAHLNRGNIVMWYNTTDDRTEFTKVSLLNLFRASLSI
jgi:hypothetical protein